MKTVSKEEFAKMYGQDALKAFNLPTDQTTDRKGFFSKVAEVFNTRVGKAQEAQQRSIQGQTSPLTGTLSTIGQGAGFVGDVAGEAIMSVGKALLPKRAEEAVASGASAIFGSKPVQEVATQYQQLKAKYPEAIENLESIVNIGSLIPIGAGGTMAGRTATKVADTAIDTAVSGVTKSVDEIARIAKPVVTEEKALGQILQGKTGVQKQGLEAIKSVDTTKVKTFKDLENAFTQKVSELAKVVDEDLALDNTLTKLDDIALVRKTAQGDIPVNYVRDALTQLDELYKVSGDVVEQANIRALINKANTEGLSRLEVNNIARNYGQEFGTKAFSKMGDPLTSVNARMYENTRKGLKDTARQAITGDSAKKADEAMSRILNTQILIRKNVEAVNKHKNRIEERKLLEKVGHGLSKYADILTGGTIRGLVGGLLPRGAGYKTLNALDLEELLQRNLKIINEAGKAKTTTQFKSKIEELFNKDLLKK